MVLTHPKLNGADLSYGVEILDGDMPASGGEVALFIDVIGRPLSPACPAAIAAAGGAPNSALLPTPSRSTRRLMTDPDCAPGSDFF